MTKPIHDAPLWKASSKLAKPSGKSSQRSFRSRLLRVKAKAQQYYMQADAAGKDIEVIGRSWSRLADHMLDIALKQAWAETPQANRFWDASIQSGPVPGLFILGLGKLGGCDLNFSSDVDIVSFYDAETIPVPEHAGRADICARVLRKMTKLLDDRSSGQFVWRVDWRLRPDPSVTNLSMSSAAGENYYFFRAAPWRRLAMLKSRPVAGDKQAANQFLQVLHPFIWRRHLDLRALDEIADMKDRIHAEHPGLESARLLDEPLEKAENFHLKLGRGGIRDIEFYINAQQLVWGGREKALQTTHTLSALAALVDTGLVEKDHAQQLRAAYKGLRALENRVQYWSDGHQHHLPEDGEQQKWLAEVSGFANWEELTQSLKQWRIIASSAFDALFHDEEERQTPETTNPETANKALEALPEAEQKIAASWTSKAFRPYGIHETNIEGLVKVGGKLQSIAMVADEPPLAVQHIHQFLLKLPPGGQYLRLFQERPWLVSQVFKPLTGSPAMADLLMQSPHVVDGLVAKPLPETIKPDLKTGAAMLAAASRYEGKLEAARAWVNEQLYRGYLATFEERISFAECEIFLTQLAEGAIALTAEVVAKEMGRSDFPLAVLALGKLGMGAMTPRSDLDLIFVAPDDLDMDVANKIASRFVSALTAPMREGRIYETDTRLRPSGRAGPPTLRYSSFHLHQTERSKTWELIAQVPMRVVYGEDVLAQKITDTRKTAIATARNRLDIKSDAIEMLELLRQERIFKRKDDPFEVKLSPGGLMEAEYISAFDVLLPNEAHALSDNTGFQTAIRHLRDSLFAYRLYGKNWPQCTNAIALEQFTAAKKLVSQTVKSRLLKKSSVSAQN